MANDVTISRRQFLKTLGGGIAAAAAVSACGSGNQKSAASKSASGDSEGQMTYRTDLHGQQVSLLGYGCMRFPTKGGLSGREDRNAELDQEQINRLIDYAIEHGVNLFDTSPAYCQGKSEGALGKALSRHNRSEFLVSTKLSNFANSTRESSMAMYKKSFQELQVDYIDYYLLHGIGSKQQMQSRYVDNGMLDFLVGEREAGRIRNLGFSFHGDKEGFDYLLALNETYHWDFILIQHNFVDWNHAAAMNSRNLNSEYTYTELEKRNIPVLVMEPLLGGRLANLNDHATALLKQREPDASVASWAFRFAGSQPRILSVLSGMTYMEHLQDNVKTYSPLKPLSDDDLRLLAHIADIYASFPMVPCNTCQYCMPCPYGLDIPGIFSHYNKCINEGLVVEDIKDPEYKKARKAFLVGYDRSVPRLRQANHCISCNHCIPECPQRINIPQEMHRIDRFVEALKIGDADLGEMAVLASLLKQLDAGRLSCVISNNGEVSTYRQSGVQDLYDLLSEGGEKLKGALVADKIIGRGAAAMMVLGGVKAVNTHTISTPALQMLRNGGVKVYFDTEVDYIENRHKTGQCPLDSRLQNLTDPKECWPVIQQFVADLRAGVDVMQ